MGIIGKGAQELFLALYSVIHEQSQRLILASYMQDICKYLQPYSIFGPNWVFSSKLFGKPDLNLLHRFSLVWLTPVPPLLSVPHMQSHPQSTSLLLPASNHSLQILSLSRPYRAGKHSGRVPALQCLAGHHFLWSFHLSCMQWTVSVQARDTSAFPKHPAP